MLVCCPENHLPSIKWETKLGKQIAVVLRKSSATLTSTRADAAYLRSANRTDDST